ncbi:unnamed protein product [Blepharisma stoltei]|uniref:RING-type domain-containing protein n=1 Tax=Blepharisma stoltei TaxID=1481888 RepID=A0AAU9JI69_9CILI|nr:unnamed protein product [Blepharisma stoltei]
MQSIWPANQIRTIFVIFAWIWADGVSLDIGLTMNISQASLWTYIELNTSGIQYYYTSIKLEIKSRDFQCFPLLSLGLMGMPEFLKISDIYSVTGDYTDFYSYENQLNEHQIILDSTIFKNNSKAYLGIAYPSYWKNSSLFYSITFFQSNSFICASGCSSHGRCSGIDQCLCNFAYIGRNCGIKSTYLVYNKPGQLTIENDNIEYFFIDLSNWHESNLLLNCSWIGETSILFIGKPSTLANDLPNKKNYYSWISLTKDASSQDAIISDLSNFKIILLAIFNTYTDSGQNLSISCTWSEDSSSSSNLNVTIIWISIPAFIVALLMISLILWFYRRVNRVHTIHHSHDSTLVGINIDIIQNYYPIYTWRDLKNVIEDTEICVVCMENFEEDSKVRKLICDHVFHAECIDEWFKQHKFCCVCKKDCEAVETLFSQGCSQDIRMERTSLFTDRSNDLNVQSVE